MRLRRLRLRNIRSHRLTDISLGEGCTLFRGDMGSGKSTILMAIEFALFGTGDLRADSLVTKGESRGEVELTFEVDGVEYGVSRAIKVSNGRGLQEDTSLVVDGMTKLLNPTDLKSEVLRILGFREPSNPRATSRIYRYAVYTPQEEIKSILSGNGREETIRRAFGVDDYKVAASNAKSVIAGIKSDMAALAPRFERLTEWESEERSRRDALEGLLSERSALVGTPGSGINAMEKSVSDAEESLRDAERRLSEARSAVSERERLRGDIAERERSLDSLIGDARHAAEDLDAAETDMAEAGTVQPPEVPLSEVESRLAAAEAAESRRQRAAGELDACRAELSALPGKSSLSVGDCAGKLASLESRREMTAARSRELAASLGAADSEASALRGALERESTLEGTCERCGSTLDADHVMRLVAERRAELAAAEGYASDLRAEAADTEAGLSGLDADISSARSDLDRARAAESAEARRSVLEETIAGLEGDTGGSDDISGLRALRDGHARWKEAQERASAARLRGANARARLSELGARRDAARERIAELTAELDSLVDTDVSGLEGAVSAASAELTGRRAALSGARERLAALSAGIDAAKSDLGRLGRDIADAKVHRSRHSRLSEYAAWLKSPFIPALSAMEARVMASTLYEFDEYYRKWYSLLVEDSTKSSYIGEGFTPILEQDGISQSVENLSGGEKTSVALAYRLALNGMVRRQTGLLDGNLIILDEPTDGFSREQMTKVRDLLEGLGADQVIMVSHEAEMEGYADRVHRVTKEGGVSTVSGQ